MANSRQGRQPLLDLPLPFMDVLLHLIQSKDDDIAKYSALCLSNLVMDPDGKTAESSCDNQIRGKESGTESVYVRVNHKGQRVSHADAVESGIFQAQSMGSHALTVLPHCHQKQIQDFSHGKISDTPTKRTLTLVCTIAGRTLFSTSCNSLNLLTRCFVAAHTVRAENFSSTAAPVPETSSSVSVPRMRYLAGIRVQFGQTYGWLSAELACASLLLGSHVGGRTESEGQVYGTWLGLREGGPLSILYSIPVRLCVTKRLCLFVCACGRGASLCLELATCSVRFEIPATRAGICSNACFPTTCMQADL